MGFHDVALMPSRASLPQHFIEIVGEVKASGPPHVLEMRSGVIKGMLPV